jgi:hypothetical protein
MASGIVLFWYLYKDTLAFPIAWHLWGAARLHTDSEEQVFFLLLHSDYWQAVY